jgi:hypothetical protein
VAEGKSIAPQWFAVEQWAEHLGPTFHQLATTAGKELEDPRAMDRFAWRYKKKPWMEHGWMEQAGEELATKKHLEALGRAQATIDCGGW